MINQSILARFQKNNPSSSGDKQKVLYLPCNKSHFEMAVIIAEKSKFESFIYAHDLEILSRQYVCNNTDTKIKFILSESSVASFLPAISKVVIFYGSIGQLLISPIKNIVATCLAVKKPIYEIPHGLFQAGQNLTDDAKLLDICSYYDGIGENLPSVANKKLSWLGEEGFGYPRTALKTSYPKRVLPNFTLITSNTNWFLYTPADIRLFFREIFNHAEQHPTELYIWCPHPAELTPDTFSHAALEFRPKNFLLYGLHKDIYFHNLEGSDDLIPYCRYGITTVSTCLLDYEIHEKRVNIFRCDGVANLIELLKNKTTFSHSEEITSNASPLITGLLKEFDVEKFDTLIFEKISDDSFVSPDYLSFFSLNNY